MPWQNIWNNIQIMEDIKEELENQEEVRRGGGISLIYLPFFIKKWKPCYRTINSWSRNLRTAL